MTISLTVDPETQAAGLAALHAFCDAWPIVAENFMDFIPDLDERRAFGEKAAEELRSGKYHVYIDM
jgi:hypothetical protein